MTQSIIMLCVLMICYFAIRVNRIEGRMNVLERHLREVYEKEGLDTERLGKPFDGSMSIKDVWQAVKEASKGR